MISLILLNLIGMSPPLGLQVAPLYGSGREFSEFFRSGEAVKVMTCSQVASVIDLSGFYSSDRGKKIDPPMRYCKGAVLENYRSASSTYRVVFVEEAVLYNDNFPYRWKVDDLQPAKLGKRYLVFMDKWDGRTGNGLSRFGSRFSFVFSLDNSIANSPNLYMGSFRMPWFSSKEPSSSKEIMVNLLEGCLRDEETAKECLQILYSIRNPSQDKWLINEFTKLADDYQKRTTSILAKVNLVRIAYHFGGRKFLDSFFRLVSDDRFRQAVEADQSILKSWMLQKLTSPPDYNDEYSSSEWSKAKPMEYAMATKRLSWNSVLCTRMMLEAEKPVDTRVLDVYASIALQTKNDTLFLDVVMTLYNWTKNPNFRDNWDKPNLERLRKSLKDIYPNAEKLPPIREGD
jgi:hypothetical protein